MGDPYQPEPKPATISVAADDYLDARMPEFESAEKRGDIVYDKARGEVVFDRELLSVQCALVRACPEKYELKGGRLAPLNLSTPNRWEGLGRR